MYNLGEQFKLNVAKAVATADNVIKGEHYRFTVLSPRVIRLEYSKAGIFTDAPTELIWQRDMPKTKFRVNEGASTIEIETEYFHLTYLKEKEFLGNKVNPAVNLKVSLLGTDRAWYYGHPEIRNFGTPPTTFDEGNLKEHGLYSAEGIASIDDSNHKIFNEDGTISPREAEEIDIYLFMYNKDFEKALTDYYDLTGYPALIPRYALGNWWSRNNDYDDLELKELVDNFERKELPLSIVLLDKDWHKRIYEKDKHLKTGFTFNDEYFKNPGAMINYLHGKNIRMGLNIDPTEGFYNIDDNYTEALKYLTEENNHIPFNVYDPKVIDTYLKLFIHPLDNLGVDFYWLDMFKKSKISDYALLKHYQFYDMMRDYKRRPMVLAKNFALAPHRYPVLYSGKTVVSWKTLKDVNKFNITTFNTGASMWAHDIGGYYKGTEDNELYIRFVQLGCFSPILKFGADKGKYYKREPWRWGIKTYTIVSDYLRLRHKLIPYIYSEVYKYHKFGTPLIKPLYYTNPDLYDDVLYSQEYYFGNALFVCPIVTQKDYVMNRSVHNFYIPEGIWYDFVTGKKFPGGKNYVSFFRDEEYPVFAKAGAIIPMGKNEHINDTTPPKDMEIQIFPGKSNSYTLFEDDGESDLYRKDFYLLTEIEYNYLPNNYSVIIRAKEGKSGIIPDKRNYKIIFRNTKRTDDVKVYSNRDEVSFKTYVDGPDFIVEVPDINTTGQFTVSCKGKDIEIDAVHLINKEIEEIISDLQISTEMKEKIDSILFGSLEIKKKRIEIRKLAKLGLDKKFIKMFLKLLEYIDQI